MTRGPPQREFLPAVSPEGDCPDCGMPRANHVIVWEEIPEGNPNVPYVAHEGDLRFACSTDTPSEKKRQKEEASKRAAEWEEREKARKAEERRLKERQRKEEARRKKLLRSMGGRVESCTCGDRVTGADPFEPDWYRHGPQCAFYKAGDEKERKRRERQKKRMVVTEEEAQAGLSALFGGKDGA